MFPGAAGAAFPPPPAPPPLAAHNRHNHDPQQMLIGPPPPPPSADLFTVALLQLLVDNLLQREREQQQQQQSSLLFQQLAAIQSLVAIQQSQQQQQGVGGGFLLSTAADRGEVGNAVEENGKNQQQQKGEEGEELTMRLMEEANKWKEMEDQVKLGLGGYEGSGNGGKNERRKTEEKKRDRKRKRDQGPKTWKAEGEEKEQNEQQEQKDNEKAGSNSGGKSNVGSGKRSRNGKRRRLDQLTDSPVSGMFIKESCDEEELRRAEMELHEMTPMMNTTEQARRAIAAIPNVIGESQCALCRIRFEDVFRLAMHRCPRIHHQEYRCEECDKIFSCPANLASHQRWHKPRENAVGKNSSSAKQKGTVAAANSENKIPRPIEEDEAQKMMNPMAEEIREEKTLVDAASALATLGYLQHTIE